MSLGTLLAKTHCGLDIDKKFTYKYILETDHLPLLFLVHKVYEEKSYDHLLCDGMILTTDSLVSVTHGAS